MIHCPKCDRELPPVPGGLPQSVRCQTCSRDLEILSFPARSNPAPPPAAKAATDGEALCFHCQTKMAISACESCGSYLCASCRAEWFGANLCLSCIHTNREVRQSLEFRSHSTIHDNVALMLMVLPLLFVPFYGIFIAMLTAPISLFMVVRHRKSPRGLVPRGPFRLISAGVLSVLLLLGAVTLVGLTTYGLTELITMDEPGYDSSFDEYDPTYSEEE